MRFFCIFLMVFLLSLRITALSASKPIFSLSETRTFKLHYSKEVIYREINVNNILLEELARITLKDPYSVNLEYHFDILSSIELPELNDYNASFRIGNFSCSGDVMYKDFDLTPFLLPDKAGLLATVYWRDHLEIASYHFTDIPVSPDGSFLLEFSFTDLNGGENYRSEIEHIELKSPFSNAQDLRLQLERIDEFYAASTLIEQLLSEMNLVFEQSAFFDPSLLVLAEETERILTFVESQNFNELHPPSELIEKYATRISIARNKLTSLKLHIPGLLCNNNGAPGYSQEELASAYSKRIEEYLSNSEKIAYEHRSFYHKCGIIDHTTGVFNNIRSGKYSVPCDPFPPSLHDLLVDAYLQGAAKHIENSNYKVASDILHNAVSLYQATHGEAIPVHINILKSKANYGLYNSFLTIADRAVKAGNLAMAERYVRSADEFQKNNVQTIISGEEVRKKYENLIYLNIQKALGESQEGKYSAALTSFDKATDLSHNIGRFNFDYDISHGIIQTKNGYYNELLLRAGDYLNNNDVMTGEHYYALATQYRENNKTIVRKQRREDAIATIIAEVRYREYFFNGSNLFKEKNYLKAYEYLSGARDLRVQFNLERYPGMDQMLDKSGRYVVTRMLETGLASVIANDLHEAEHCLIEAKNFLSVNKIQEDDLLMEAIGSLEQKVNNKQCQNRQIQIETLMHEARIASLGIRYTEAYEKFNQALELTSSGNDCNFKTSDSLLFAAINSTRTPAQYQQYLQDIRYALEKSDSDRFEESLLLLLAIRPFLRDNTPGIELFPLQDMLKDPYYENRILQHLDHFLYLKKPVICLEILKILQINGFSSRTFAKQQVQLGQILAELDIKGGAAADPSYTLANYHLHPSWFRNLEKSYINTYKKKQSSAATRQSRF